MSKVFVEQPSTSSTQEEALARNLERLAWLMDRAIRVPGTRISIGLDAILGLLPIGGDVLTGLVQAGLVLVALSHYKVPKHVAARMMANVLIDIGIGSIPLLGDLFDIAFKANTKNLELLKPYRAQRVIDITPSDTLPPSKPSYFPRGTPWRYIVPIALVLFAAIILVAIGFVTVVRWLIHQ